MADTDVSTPTVDQLLANYTPANYTPATPLDAGGITQAQYEQAIASGTPISVPVPAPQPVSPVTQAQYVANVQAGSSNPSQPAPTPTPAESAAPANPQIIGQNQDGSPIYADATPAATTTGIVLAGKPLPPTPPPVQKAGKPAGIADLERMNNAGFAQEAKGEQAVTNATMAQNNAVSSQLNQNITDQEQARKDMATQAQAETDKTNMLLQKQQDMVDDFKTSHVDPRNYWTEVGVPGKILSVLAMAAGGFAGGYSGRGGNAAADMIDTAIRNDIEAQRANIETKGKAIDMQNTLLGRNMDFFQNEQQARAATYKNLLDGQVAKVEALKASTQNPITAANLGVVLGDLKQKQAVADSTLRDQVSDRVKNYAEAGKAGAETKKLNVETGVLQTQQLARQYFANGQGPQKIIGKNPDGTNKVGPLDPQERAVYDRSMLNVLPETERKLAVHLPDGSIKLASSEDNAKEISDNFQKLTTLSDALNNIKTLRQNASLAGEAGTYIPFKNTDYQTQVDNAYSRALSVLMQDDKMRFLNDKSLDVLRNTLPKKSDIEGLGVFNTQRVSNSIDSTIAAAKQAMADDLRSRGIINPGSNEENLNAIKTIPVHK